MQEEAQSCRPVEKGAAPHDHETDEVPTYLDLMERSARCYLDKRPSGRPREEVVVDDALNGLCRGSHGK
ncbi:hypothetical protein GGTG_06863 [Gaeumannomyces tritici R3-111a-1]|uniref:Uncharacterized protein n=1 Tax=Gaeumannomyces tritici (strain R3-111a-1) TaxID=644352 RepID=J3P016_GAET3|nr:hypothetical protein GGTG_06863 [Gaeumannomyces tritici R3-111a-1]EJT76949.1 hypothetical protein GGTG_06863 [Gaeumannomyces tritici R3-111a-1]